MMVVVANLISRSALAWVLSILVRSEIKTHANVLILSNSSIYRITTFKGNFK